MIDQSTAAGVATITINDPERRNPLSNATMDALRIAVDRTAVDDTVRVVVITGAGDRAFSAGGDLSAGFVDEPLAGHPERAALAGLIRSMHTNPKPIIARVNGVALGGGFGVAVAADITIAADDVRMGTPEIDIGLWPMMISAVLVRSMPRKALLDMMLTGRVIAAEEALAYGLVTRVVTRDRLDAEVDEVVRSLQAKSPAALALGKRAYYSMEDMDADTALDHLHIGLTTTSMTRDAAEGVAAFIGKRSPEWTGR